MLLIHRHWLSVQGITMLRSHMDLDGPYHIHWSLSKPAPAGTMGFVLLSLRCLGSHRQNLMVLGPYQIFQISRRNYSCTDRNGKVCALRLSNRLYFAVLFVIFSVGWVVRGRSWGIIPGLLLEHFLPYGCSTPCKLSTHLVVCGSNTCFSPLPSASLTAEALQRLSYQKGVPIMMAITWLIRHGSAVA